MADIPKTGLTPETIKNMVFGAGVLYKNFSYGDHYKQTFDTTPQSGKKYYYISGGPGGIGYTEFDGTYFAGGVIYYEKYTGYGGEKIGATKEGAKVSIKPEYTDIDVDGVLVKMEGLIRKIGEKATIEATVIDLSLKNIASAINGNINYASNDPIVPGSKNSFISTKSDISITDYISNLALVARRIDNNNLTIIIFKKALCTGGFEIDTKNKEAAGCKFVFEAYAEQTDRNVDTLPVEIIMESSN